MKTRMLTGLTILAFLLTAAFTNPIGLAQAACGDPTSGVLGGIACGTSPVPASTGVQRAINLLLYLVGIISIIVIIVGALRYVLSGGDPKNTAAAKDTILYAVIGLVIALLAYGIVNFVLQRFGA